jgi:hypothetical protein
MHPTEEKASLLISYDLGCVEWERNRKFSFMLHYLSQTLMWVQGSNSHCLQVPRMWFF